MGIKHRRGFIKESEEYAFEFRSELGLQEHEPLDPFQLAEHLSIPVHKLSGHPAIDDKIKSYFLHEANNDFSATTLQIHTRKEIIHNDGHHIYRQNSNIAHELAHIILGHPPKPPMLKDGCRNFDKKLEREAHDLGFTLLVPKVAALYAIEKIGNISLASKYYQVSQNLLKFRINKSDARRWAANRRKKYFS